jgi:hypothetical protein
MPVHHALFEYLDAYIEAAGIGNDKRSPLFRSAPRRSGQLTNLPMRQSDAHARSSTGLAKRGLRA